MKWLIRSFYQNHYQTSFIKLLCESKILEPKVFLNNINNKNDIKYGIISKRESAVYVKKNNRKLGKRGRYVIIEMYLRKYANSIDIQVHKKGRASILTLRFEDFCKILFTLTLEQLFKLLLDNNMIQIWST